MSLDPNSQNITFHNEDGGLSLQELIYIFRKHQRIIVLITGLILIIASFYTLLMKPTYKSTGLIMIEDPYQTMNIFDISSLGGKNFLLNEIEIIKSRSTAEKTVQKLLDSEFRNNLYLFDTREYSPNWIKNIPGINLLKLEKRPSIINRVVSDSLFNRFTTRLGNSMTIINKKNTDMLSISMYSKDADEAALIVNTLIEVYSTIDLEWVRGEMTHLEQFLSYQIAKKESQLADSEEALQKFQEKEQVYAIDENSTLLLNNLINAESKYYQAKVEGNVIDERKKYILSQLTEEEKKLSQSVSNSINNRLYALKNEVAMKETELISAIAQQGENHQIVKTLREKLKRLKERLEEETRDLITQGISVANPIEYRQALMDSVISIDASIAMLESKSIELRKLVNEYQNQLGLLPEKVLEFTRLTRNMKIYADTYSLMRQKLEEVRITEASQMGKVRIVDAGHPNYYRISPKNKRNVLLGLLIGLGMGIGMAFLREYMDNTITTITEIEKRDLSILALIPAIGNKNRTKDKIKKYQKIGDAEKIQRRLITHEDPKSPISEVYRGLRTSLLYSQRLRKDNGNVILISSPGPGEGKTTTISNLAITYANLGLKTILIDTDLRKPVAHKVFSVERAPGITKVLSGIESDYSKIIQKTNILNLDIITAGVIPPNPSEILESSYMGKLMKELREKYDVILMDAPPLLAVTDAFVCMKYIDQFILIIRSGVTEKVGLDRSIDKIKQTNIDLAGVVVNAIDESNSYYSGYYSNYYQYYHGDEG